MSHDKSFCDHRVIMGVAILYIFVRFFVLYVQVLQDKPTRDRTDAIEQSVQDFVVESMNLPHMLSRCKW